MNIYGGCNISDFSSLAGVFNYDSTPVPGYIQPKPKKITPADRGAIFLLAIDIKKNGLTKRKAEVILKKLQKNRKLPRTQLQRRLLVALAMTAANDAS